MHVLPRSNRRGNHARSAADYHYIVGFSCHRCDCGHEEHLQRELMPVTCSAEAPISVGKAAVHGAACYFNS